MSDATDRTAALATLKLYVQDTVEPTLSSGDLDTLIDGNKRAATWIASTAYNYGDVVRPTVRNGHYFRCIQAGTSGTTEPIWPKSQQSTVNDGTSNPALQWQEAGPDNANIYDVRTAIHQGWMLKAAKASVLYLTRQSRDEFDHNQIYEHCIQQAEKFSSVNMA